MYFIAVKENDRTYSIRQSVMGCNYEIIKMGVRGCNVNAVIRKLRRECEK
jgi:hypothetical protein